jgi:hypothetical protein
MGLGQRGAERLTMKQVVLVGWGAAALLAACKSGGGASMTRGQDAAGTSGAATTTTTSGATTYSGDAGDIQGTWSMLPGNGLPASLASGCRMDINANGIIYVAANGIGVYMSTDQGASFVKLAPPYLTNDLVNHTGFWSITHNRPGEVVVGLGDDSGGGQDFLFRLDLTKKQWINGSAAIMPHLGAGYFASALGTDANGNVLAGYLFEPGLAKSTDDGSTFNGLVSVPSSGWGTFGINPTSGELFVGTEERGETHSTDNGATFSQVWGPEFGTTFLLGNGGNGYGTFFNKDSEAIVSSAGQPKGIALQRLTYDGNIVDAVGNFGIYGFAYNSQSGDEWTPATNGRTNHIWTMVLTNNGVNFFTAKSGYTMSVDIMGSVDGNAWVALGQPFVPLSNCIATDGGNVFAASAAGQVWKFAPTVTNHIPTVSAGPSQTTSVGSALGLQGTASDADNDPLTYSWHVRVPQDAMGNLKGSATFSDATSLKPSVTFSAAGDYVLTLVADDGVRSAGAGVIVHVH